MNDGLDSLDLCKLASKEVVLSPTRCAREISTISTTLLLPHGWLG